MMAKIRVTNVSDGPRVINTIVGGRLVESGVTVPVELDDAELASAKASGWFTFGNEKKQGA